jgi:hypothetical protein
MPRANDITDTPSMIIKEYSNVHLSIDIMHVNGIKFLISHSKHIGLLQTYCVRKNNRVAILSCILKMIQTYKSRSMFTVVSIEADGAFESIKHELQDKPYNVALTTYDADRHVETVERQIRFLKERIRAVRVIMPYKKIPKRFTIEMVNKITMLVNSLPKQNGVHSFLSPREIVMGKKFICPSIKIGQYVQCHTGGTNDTDKERSVDSLYIGRAGNGSGHRVFKLNIKQPISVNRVTIIPNTEATIKMVNDIGEQENQPEGIQFSDMHGRITLQDFAANDNDDDSNASDDDFKMDEEYQDAIDEEVVLEEEEESVGNNDPDLQEDYFQNPIQQHNTATNDNNEPVPVILDNCTRSANNPVVNLVNTTRPTTKQECRSEKKKKQSIVEEETAMTEEDLEEDPVLPDSAMTDDVKANDDTIVDVEAAIPNELKPDLGS